MVISVADLTHSIISGCGLHAALISRGIRMTSSLSSAEDSLRSQELFELCTRRINGDAKASEAVAKTASLLNSETESYVGEAYFCVRLCGAVVGPFELLKVENAFLPIFTISGDYGRGFVSKSSLHAIKISGSIYHCLAGPKESLDEPSVILKYKDTLTGDTLQARLCVTSSMDFVSAWLSGFEYSFKERRSIEHSSVRYVTGCGSSCRLSSECLSKDGFRDSVSVYGEDFSEALSGFSSVSLACRALDASPAETDPSHLARLRSARRQVQALTSNSPAAIK